MAHEELKKQYDEDALWHPRPWEMWEFGNFGFFGTLSEPPVWHSVGFYRRKPDAPERNCGMCKYNPKSEGFGVLCRHPDNKENWQLWGVDIDTESPEWCPLDQHDHIKSLRGKYKEMLPPTDQPEGSRERKGGRMKKQRHCWVHEDKNGAVVLPNAAWFDERDNQVAAFVSRGAANESKDKGERVVKYVPENKELVRAAREVASMFTSGTGLVDYLRMNQKGAIDRLIMALAKEA